MWILELGTGIFFLFSSQGSFFVGAQSFLASLALDCAWQVSSLVFHFLAAPIFLFIVSVLVLELISWRLQAQAAQGQRSWNHVEMLRSRQDLAALMHLAKQNVEVKN